MIRRIWQRNPILTLAFLLALAACFFFTGRAMNMALILANRADKPVAGWMTPRYIARSYGLEREDLAAVLATADRDDARQPLYSLAQEQGLPVADLIAEVQALVDAQEGVE
ncbi:hypothetical protein C0V75_08910 [Tabrizicola sp. TH137]|uniref:hypothetical protein n=1 Tax=Tabrizicola sp. TH137 TaxID=2067452 RepID=UPI000C7B12BA|nr:hypothetical protein [Tabrizicola sp. TH137]PLL13480.1 hypothetical protein C0V75_08910 [Tabrizicola sp. TH137]